METSVTSSRSLIRFYLAMAGAVLFFLVMASFTGALHDEAINKTGNVIMILMSLSLLFMGGYTIFRFYKIAPSLELDETSITFNKTDTYYWKDLEKVELSGKLPFIFLTYREGIIIKFKGQDIRGFLDFAYINTPEIKTFIQQVVIDKKPFNFSSLKEIGSETVAAEPFVFYKGYQLLCVEGIALWLFLVPILFFLIKLLIKSEFISAIVVLSLGALLFLTFGLRLYYFGLSDDYLAIQLHNVPWFRKIYRLADIKEIVFETESKMPTCLRVITNNFESKLYPAGSLWSKRWLELKKDLEDKNIKVRNECVYYEPFEFKWFN